MKNEWAVQRTENKYLLTYSQAINLIHILDRLLTRDSFSTNGPYMVRSLYFDTPCNTDYFTKIAGTENRKKLRIRIYDAQTNWCKLEVKSKSGNLQHKTSLRITKKDAVSLINGEISVLKNYFEQSNNAAKIYSMMMMETYRPSAIIEYDRLAFMHELNDTRITFDMNIRSTESSSDLFNAYPLYYPALIDNVVLEVKYNGQLLDYISKVLQPFELNKQSLSKYCLGRKVLENII